MKNLQQQNEELKAENEKLLDLLSQTQAVLELAILETPSSVVRNTLTKRKIQIDNILNPELVLTTKTIDHE